MGNLRTVVALGRGLSALFHGGRPCGGVLMTLLIAPCWKKSSGPVRSCQIGGGGCPAPGPFHVTASFLKDEFFFTEASQENLL